jgi:hypothetical protein
MATHIIHTQQVWNLTDLDLSEKIILNYLWAWKARGNAITVTNSYLESLYNMRPMDVAHKLQVLQSKGYIDISYVPGGPRVIQCNPLDTQRDEGPDDVFNHLY